MCRCGNQDATPTVRVYTAAEPGLWLSRLLTVVLIKNHMHNKKSSSVSYIALRWLYICNLQTREHLKNNNRAPD